LKVLEMQDHQAVFVAHNDTAHRHVHVIVNRVHPETRQGEEQLPRPSKNFQAWALEQERAHGKVFCKAREFNALARQVAQGAGRQARAGPVRGQHGCRMLEPQRRRPELQGALEAKGWGLAKRRPERERC
jgi:predicted ABC-class ATPase